MATSVSFILVLYFQSDAKTDICPKCEANAKTSKTAYLAVTNDKKYVR
jgi:hypothetical protein